MKRELPRDRSRRSAVKLRAAIDAFCTDCISGARDAEDERSRIEGIDYCNNVTCPLFDVRLVDPLDRK